jgi:hypothetical protein
MKLGTIYYVEKKDWEALQTAETWWKGLCETDLFDEVNLHGGLDHVTATKKQITFHDIGCNGRDNTFTIRIKI